MNVKIESLLSEMTLEEKASMLAGADHWTTVPVERLGIPAIKVTDGPVGARGARRRGGPRSVCFPAPGALAATWNPDLARRVGSALGEETIAKGAHILLAPTVNIHRSPLAGRHFECYSEDPLLSARMAVAYIQGLQSRGVGACIKHFVCNDSEFERRSMSSEVGERALHEIYLTPFRIALREARPWAVMSAYNKLNGTWCSENPHLLLEILKGDWGFDGLVISDWWGTYSPAVVQGGLDLEMPGPARWMGNGVLKAVQSGQVSETVINDKTRRLLRTIERAGAFENPAPQTEQAVDRSEHRRLAREVATEAIVLLKNADGLLPLDVESLQSIAVIGQNARWAAVQGGGSAHVTPHYTVSPLDGIRSRAGGEISVEYAIGCPIHKRLPLVDVSLLSTADGSVQGLIANYFSNTELAGDPVHTEVNDQVELEVLGASLSGVDPGSFSTRWSGQLAAQETGQHSFSLMAAGQSRLFLDGVEVIDNWSRVSAEEDPEPMATIDLVAGRSYPIQIDYRWTGKPGGGQLRLGHLPPLPADPAGEAADLAARSDVAIVFAGTTDEWESEGGDQAAMELPGDQAQLILRVSAANPNTIVVLSTGSPVPMDWLDRVPAVLQAWFGGQETGNAIASVLFGDVSPSGRLPTTFPKRLRDNPAYLNYPGENGKVLYGEGIFVGYRYYDKKGIEPLFPFGHGLSYTTFAYRRLTLDAETYGPGEEIRVAVQLENTGARRSKEVVQLYIRDLASTLVRPEKELKAFAKVELAPGETRTVHFFLDEEALSFYDPARAGWVSEAGEFEVLVGRSAGDVRLAARFTLRSEANT